jgi:hypothetical protein
MELSISGDEADLVSVSINRLIDNHFAQYNNRAHGPIGIMYSSILKNSWIAEN